MAKPLVKEIWLFPYRATLINKKIILRQKDSFAKSQNITKGTADASSAKNKGKGEIYKENIRCHRAAIFITPSFPV